MLKLATQAISKVYDGSYTIQDINIYVKEQEIVALLGISGVGKTTLFNILAGIEKPTTGEVFLNHEVITGTSGRLSYMQQKDLLMPYKTVLDNVALPILLRGYKKSQAREMARGHFETFGLSGTENKYPIQLSGGMRQRAAFLRTYLFSQEMMLLDEPFSALDMITKSNMHRWYLEIMNQVKASALFITHDIDEAITLADRIYIMSGRPGVISQEIVINEKRSREEAFNTSEKFISYKKQILKYITYA